MIDEQTPRSKAQAVKDIAKAPMPRVKQVAGTKKALMVYTVVGTASVQQGLNKVYPGCGDAMADVISSMSSFVIPGL